MTKEEILKSIDNEESVTVTLTLLDDSEIECEVVTIVSAMGKDYIALLPMDGPEKDTGNVYLYGFQETLDGSDPELIDITDDEEYEAAADAFEEYLDGLEFDELVEEDEAEDQNGSVKR